MSSTVSGVSSLSAISSALLAHYTAARSSDWLGPISISNVSRWRAFAAGHCWYTRRCCSLITEVVFLHVSAPLSSIPAGFLSRSRVYVICLERCPYSLPSPAAKDSPPNQYRFSCSLPNLSNTDRELSTHSLTFFFSTFFLEVSASYPPRDGGIFVSYSTALVLYSFLHFQKASTNHYSYTHNHLPLEWS